MRTDVPGEYANGLLTRLGDRDMFESMAASPTALRRAVEGVDDTIRRRPERPGKWSMLDVVHHLADAELVIGFRIRMILTQDQPPIAAYDQDVWANKLQYSTGDLPTVLRQFESLREANLHLARQLTSDDLQRIGVHSERGGESVGYTLRLTAGHDLVHLDQLERIRRAVS